MPLASPDEIHDDSSPVAPASRVMKGTPFGRVYPGVSPDLAHKDARRMALETFALFVSLLRFQRTGDMPDGKPLAFSVPRQMVHLYQPDDVAGHAPRPGIGVLPGRATHEPYGLGPPEVLDDTADVYGPGTVLVRRSDHVETLALEIVAAKEGERQGVVAGLKQALQMDDRSGALRLVCRNYFDRVASFRLDESESIDDDGATLNRRRAHLYVLLQVQEVSLIAYRRVMISYEARAERGEDAAPAPIVDVGNLQVDLDGVPGTLEVDLTEDPGNLETASE